MKRERLRYVLKTALTLCAVFFYVNLYSQNIISRLQSDYDPDGLVPIEGACPDPTDLTDDNCIIYLKPVLIDNEYSDTIHLQGSYTWGDLDYYNQNMDGSCSPGSYTFNNGIISMAGNDICIPNTGESYIQIDLELGQGAANDMQRFRIPILSSRDPIKVVLVLDISQSMGQVVSGGSETSWNVLKNSVNNFTAEFEKYYQEGDSISIIYYSEDTVMPDSPIDSNFIAITPDDFTPSNLKSSEIINADMQSQTLQDSAAMGNALLLAKEKLQNTDATKVVILFTDGYQDKDPLVHKYLGNKLYNGSFLNDGPCNAIDSIRYYTVCMGSSSAVPEVLKNIAIASNAINLYTITGDRADFEMFFDNKFDDLINGIGYPIDTRIIDISPFDDSLNVPVDADLKLFFNESVTANSGYITIKRNSDDSEFESISVSSGNVLGSGSSVITINPDSDLESNTDYYILIDGTAFKNSNDINVAGISDETYWNFTTEDILSPDVVISTLESDPTNANPFEIAIDFSEEINGFDVNEIDVTNGSTDNLATSDSIEFSANITPTSDGLVTVNINSSVATDNAGNTNTTADEFTITYSAPTSIEILKNDGISIYSSNGYVIVEFKKSDSQNSKSGNIEIYSLNGSLIKKEKLENNTLFKTYLNNQRGIYLVKLTLDNNTYYAKIQN